MSVEWYKLTAENALQQVGSTADGLHGDEAARRLAQNGPNELVAKAQRSKWNILLEQFKGILTVLLVIAAIISVVLGDWIEAIAILIIVVLNGVLGYTQESRAEQSMEAVSYTHLDVYKRQGSPRTARGG